MTQLFPFARVLNGAVVERGLFEVAPVYGAPAAKGVWLPVVTIGAADPLKAVETTIGPDEVIDSWADLPLAQLKAAKKVTARAAFDAQFVGGFTVAAGPLAGKVLNVATLEDRTNWLTLQNACLAAVGADQGAVAGAGFRDRANDVHLLTYADGLAVLLAMAAWGQARYANLWAMNDATDAAADKAALDAVDVNAGWAD